jgi:hypothetical protein
MALTDDIAEAMTAHDAWKDRLQAVIEKGSTDLKLHEVEADNRCDLGKWLVTIPASSDTEEVSKIHRQFHREAAKVLSLALAGRRSDALRAMDHMSTYTAVSGQLQRSLTGWRDRSAKAPA